MKGRWGNAASLVKSENEKIKRAQDLDPCRLRCFDKTKLPGLTNGDVIVASYPNSGCDIVSRMLQTTIANIRAHCGVGTAETEFYIKTLEDLDESENQDLDEVTHNTIYTTRLRYQYLSKYAGSRKVIYVVRNPKHAAIELYNNSFFKYMTFKEFVEIFLGTSDPEDPYNYKTHFLEYMENEEELQILFLKYEDLSARPVETLHSLMSHVGLRLPLKDHTLLYRIIEENADLEDQSATPTNWSWEMFARSVIKHNFNEFFDVELLARFDRELKVDWKLVKTGIV